MTRRSGLLMDMKGVGKEIIGAIAFIFLVSLLFVHVFGAGIAELGCYVRQDCKEVGGELERFVNDVNEACQRGDLAGDEFRTLNDEAYDFSDVDTLKVSEGPMPDDWYTNTFTAEGDGFEEQMTADACSGGAKFCREAVPGIEACAGWYEDGFSDQTVFEYKTDGDSIALRKQ